MGWNVFALISTRDDELSSHDSVDSMVMMMMMMMLFN